MIISLGFYKRRPDLTHEEFLEHWKNVHGPMSANAPGSEELKVKYIQHHLELDAGDGHPLAGGGFVFDGFSESWYRTLDDRAAFFDLPTIRNDIRKDEEEFIDMTATRWMVLDNPVVQVDRTR